MTAFEDEGCYCVDKSDFFLDFQNKLGSSRFLRLFLPRFAITENT